MQPTASYGGRYDDGETVYVRPASVLSITPARVETDLLGSARHGPFPTGRVERIRSFFEDDLVALRHGKPPGSPRR